MVDDISVRKLVQIYGQIIIGYLTEAILKHEDSKKEPEKRGGLIISSGLENLTAKIDSAFGDINLDAEYQKEYGQPIISWNELANCVYNYTNQHRLGFNKEAFMSVMSDFISNLGIITAQGIRQEDKNNPRYSINTQLLAGTELNKKCYSLEEGLSNGLISEGEDFYFSDAKFGTEWESDENAEKFVPVHASKKVGHADYRDIAEEILRCVGAAQRMGNMGEGYLYSKFFYENKIHYMDFKPVINSMVNAGILMQAFSPEHGFQVLSINPAKKPFKITQALIGEIMGKPSKAVFKEVETVEDYGIPMANYIDFGGESRDFYSFKLFEGSPKGL